MKINLISHKNGVGLEKDADLLTELLTGHDVQFIELGEDRDRANVRSCRRADVNIFIELLNRHLFSFAEKNIFIPNPEWFWEIKELDRIDWVVCKTRDCERIFSIFKSKHKFKTIFTSFTANDFYQETEKKDFYLHFAGKSSFKGTLPVFSCWQRHPELPTLIFGKYGFNSQYYSTNKNIWANFNKLPFDQFVKLQNKCRFHLCLSEYEGFGHYLWEAMSTGAIIITTDAEPMRDFVNGNGVLVKPSFKQRFNLGVLNKCKSDDVYKAVLNTMKFSQSQKEEMSLRSREIFLNNDKFFRTTFKNFIDTL